MKTLITILLSLAVSATAFAQFNLSGKIKNYSGTESLQINIPLVFGFHKENSIEIPVAKDGTFNIILPVNAQKFGNLIFQRKFLTLLLTPSKDLNINLNVRDTVSKIISGSASAENKLMQQIELEEYPFFLANEGHNKLAELSFSAMQKKILEPYFNTRNAKIKKVNSSSTSTSYKKLIVAELKYISYNYLNDFARTAVSNQVVRDSLIINVFGNVNPEPEAFPAGPQYYAFVDNYIRYLETVAFTEMKKEKISTSKPIPFFKISLDSANIVVKKYGKSYWRWLGSTENFSNKVVEEFNFQLITDLFVYKDLRPLELLANFYKKKFPEGKHLSTINGMVDTLKNTLHKNEHNNEIVVYNGFEKLNSLRDVIKTLKGKVVYVDVWGTWCPPCKEELRYNPQLKARFSNKDVAFVYLDMDEDDKDSSWREFIKINNLKGIHLRKSRAAMKSFWRELLANNPDKAEYYPQYFIFDTEGKLAISKALPPSSKEELYTQIESVLNKNQRIK